MERLKKEEIVEALRGIFESTNLVVVTQFSGLSVAEASHLRRQMRAAGATFRVTKKPAGEARGRGHLLRPARGPLFGFQRDRLFGRSGGRGEDRGDLCQE